MKSVWDFLVFIVLAAVFRKRLERAPGALFLTYLGLYSVGRFLTEALRTGRPDAGPLRRGPAGGASSASGWPWSAFRSCSAEPTPRLIPRALRLPRHVGRRAGT